MLGRWRAAHSVEKRNAIRVSSDEEVMVPRPPRVGGAKDAVQGEEDEAVMVPRKLYAAQGMSLGTDSFAYVQLCILRKREEPRSL